MSNVELALTLVEETSLPLSLAEDKLAELSAFVIRSEGGAGAWDVTIALVEDDRLQQLHRDFMGEDSPTDIMTFPYAEDAEGPQGGELVISAGHVRSSEWGLGPEGELQFLVIHGLLHLLGWRDETSASREEMLARQEVLLRAWQERPRHIPTSDQSAVI